MELVAAATTVYFMKKKHQIKSRLYCIRWCGWVCACTVWGSGWAGEPSVLCSCIKYVITYNLYINNITCNWIFSDVLAEHFSVGKTLTPINVSGSPLLISISYLPSQPRVISKGLRQEDEGWREEAMSKLPVERVFSPAWVEASLQTEEGRTFCQMISKNPTQCYIWLCLLCEMRHLF